MELSLRDSKKLFQVTKALGSEMRIRILELLGECSMNVAELSQRMGVPISTMSNNVVVLEEAGLIRTERQNGVRGLMKLSSRRVDEVKINLGDSQSNGMQSFFQSMPVGRYADCHIEPVCGLAGLRSNIGFQDEPAAFYDPERFDAQLLWFQKGHVEYRFNSQPLLMHEIRCLEVSFEACSEAPNYRNDYPSDITVWINGVQIGTWTCPGDFGGRQGRNTPDWWPKSSTQYGLLKRWWVDNAGSWLDGTKISNVCLKDLNLEGLPYIRVGIGIMEDAQHQGGINLFGEQFGDYSQPIIIRLDCLKKSADGPRAGE